MNYTRGEWKIVGNSVYGGDDKSNPEIIGYLQGENRVANAHLISACPDMYKALKAITYYWREDIESYAGHLQEVKEQVSQALAKADGK